MGRRVTIQGKDGSFSAYVADGKTRDGPAIVVIQEIFGLDQYVQADVARASGLTRERIRIIVDPSKRVPSKRAPQQ